jgi:hypothetical protein
MSETRPPPALTFEDLVPWVVTLARLKKTHVAAWLQRVAAQYVYEGTYDIRSKKFTVTGLDEMEFSIACMVAHRDGKVKRACAACESDADFVQKMYKYLNNDPLIFHVWQLHHRRPELRDRTINLADAHLCDTELTGILTAMRDLPDEWYDKHTSQGKKLGRGYGHFFRVMVLWPRVYELEGDAEETSERGGVEPYEQLAKRLYLDFKIDGQEARARHMLQLSLKRNASCAPESQMLPALTCDECGGDGLGGAGELRSGLGKRRAHEVEQRADDGVDAAEVRNDLVRKNGFSGPTGVRDVDVVGLEEGRGLLGFKCATMVGTLLSLPPVTFDISGGACVGGGGGGGLVVGDAVFVKMGESLEDCLFAQACNGLKKELGMEALEMWVTRLVPTRDYPALAALSNPIWARGVGGRMARAVAQHGDEHGAVPVIISSVFHGCSLSRKPEWLKEEGGLALLKVLLFRKYVGSADTNALNMMCAESGELLSVDETAASADQMAKYRVKGLITSQKIHSDLTKKAADAVVHSSWEVADFLRRLRGLALPEVVVRGERLAAVNSSEPFDEDTLQLLEDGTDVEALKRLCRRLQLI